MSEILAPNPKQCTTCRIKDYCLCSPINKLKAYPGLSLRPIIPWLGPDENNCMSYIKEESNE